MHTKEGIEEEKHEEKEVKDKVEEQGGKEAGWERKRGGSYQKHQYLG